MQVRRITFLKPVTHPDIKLIIQDVFLNLAPHHEIIAIISAIGNEEKQPTHVKEAYFDFESKEIEKISISLVTDHELIKQKRHELKNLFCVYSTRTEFKPTQNNDFKFINVCDGNDEFFDSTEKYEIHKTYPDFQHKILNNCYEKKSENVLTPLKAIDKDLEKNDYLSIAKRKLQQAKTTVENIPYRQYLLGTATFFGAAATAVIYKITNQSAKKRVSL